MLAIGTKLSVYPIAGVVPAAKDAGARVVMDLVIRRASLRADVRDGVS